jgi:hypothetical protein
MQPNAARHLFGYDGAELSQALAAVYDTYRSGEIWVGLLVGNRMIAGGIDSSGQFRDDVGQSPRRPLFCLAKALTGTLGLLAACEGRLDFDCELAETDESPLKPWSRGVTLRHLLSHTHGLDLSHVWRTGIDSDGCIDVAALAGSLEVSLRLYEPGALYSFGNAGCWLATTLIERACGSPYTQLVIDRILRPAGIELDRRSAECLHWCPSMGGDVSLSLADWLRFLGWFLQHDQVCRHPELLQPVSPAPPGWCFERGSCAGWKSFGAGWLGQHTASDTQSVALRVHPEHKLAIVVDADVGSTYAANIILARLFGRILPEFLDMKVPRLLATAPPAGNMANCIGTYADTKSRIRVTAGDGASLTMEVFEDLAAWRNNAPQKRVALQPASQGAYIAEQLIFQFVSHPDDGITHLWNGRHVFRRLSSDTPT